MAVRFNNPIPSIVDDTGLPVAGGTIEFYVNLTTTPKNVYLDRELTTSAGSVITLDSVGRIGDADGDPAEIYLQDNTLYTLKIKDASGVLIRTINNFGEAQTESLDLSDYGIVGDGTTDDTTGFSDFEDDHTGEEVNLLGLTYLVDEEPRANYYYNGAFKISSSGRYFYKDNIVYPTPFGKANIQMVAGGNAHYGFNSQVVDVSTSDIAQYLLWYRKGEGHEVTDLNAELWIADSWDGVTFFNHRIAYKTSKDIRNFVVGRMGNGRVGCLATLATEDGVDQDGVFVYTDDKGATQPSSVTVSMPTAGYTMNFHGNLNNYPSSVGGDDTNGWFAASYGQSSDIDIVYTTDNGATWTFSVDRITDTVASGALSETTVVRNGTRDQWFAIMRCASGSDNAFVSVTANPLSGWSVAKDSGLPFGGNPPQALWEAGKIHFIGFSRRNREFYSRDSSDIMVASANADALYANGGDFGALNVGWRKITTIPNWASGYIGCQRREDGKWFGTFVCEELNFGGSTGPKNTTLAMIGDFNPVTVTPSNVKQLVSKPNLFDNPCFQITKGTTAVSGTTPQLTFPRWIGATPGGETMTISRVAPTLGQKHGDNDEPLVNWARFQGTAATASTHYFGQRLLGLNRYSGNRATFSFSILEGSSSIGSLPTIRYIQNYGTGGSPTSENSQVFATDVKMSSTIRRHELTFDIPSVVGDTLGSDGNDYFAVYLYMPQGTYDIYMTNFKLEFNAFRSKFELPNDAEEFIKCSRHFFTTYDAGIPPGTGGATNGCLQDTAKSTATSFAVTFNPVYPVRMAFDPTVTIYSPASGTAANFRNVTAGADLAAQIATDSGQRGCTITNNGAATSANLYSAHITAWTGF